MCIMLFINRFENTNGRHCDNFMDKLRESLPVVACTDLGICICDKINCEMVASQGVCCDGGMATLNK